MTSLIMRFSKRPDTTSEQARVILNEIVAWAMRDQIKMGYYGRGKGVWEFIFKNPDDAVLWKLKWGEYL